MRWAGGDEVSWPHPEMGKFAIAAGISAVRRPRVRLALAGCGGRRGAARLRVPAGTEARPLPAVGAARTPLRRCGPARHRPIAHRHPRHLHRGLDGRVRPVRAPLRPGRVAHALAPRLRRRGRHGARHQVVRRARRLRRGTHHPRLLDPAAARGTWRGVRGSGRGSGGAPKEPRSADGPRRGIGRCDPARRLRGAPRAHGHRGARRRPAGHLPAELRAVLRHRPHDRRLPGTAPADADLQSQSRRHAHLRVGGLHVDDRLPARLVLLRGQEDLLWRRRHRKPVSLVARDPLAARRRGPRTAAALLRAAAGGGPRPGPLRAVVRHHEDVLPLLHDAGGAVHGDPRRRRAVPRSQAA